jgi:hypothetical protein
MKNSLWQRIAMAVVGMLTIGLIGFLQSGGRVAPATAAANVCVPQATLRQITLYDGDLGTLPQQQQFVIPLLPPQPTIELRTNATFVDTMGNDATTAAFLARPTQPFTLNRTLGYSLSVTMRMLDEGHDGPTADKNGDNLADRAGMSFTLLGSDERGIEVAFWKDRIWAQEDGAAQPPFGTLFTHILTESVAFDTTSITRTYQIHIRDQQYTVLADGTPLLSGELRDYGALSGAFSVLYNTPNSVYVGDNTSSARGQFMLERVVVGECALIAATATPTQTATATPTQTTTATLTQTTTATLTQTATATRTPISSATPTLTVIPSATPTLNPSPAPTRYQLFLPLAIGN